MIKRVIVLISCLTLILILSACLRPLQADPLESDVPAFIPPTLIPATPTTIPTATPGIDPNATQIGACIDDLTFVDDTNYPDGTKVTPGSSIEKGWEIKNSGTCNWGSGYTIRLTGGPDLGAPSPQDLYPARSGASIEIQMEFTAPEEAGDYRSAWQAYNPSGIAFGDSFYIDFTVQN